MALTVVRPPYVQQRTPFWERVGTELLLPALADMWKTHRQNEQNRKENALKGEVLKQVEALKNAGMDTEQNGGGLLSGAPESQGYNSDGWAQAFHNTDKPLTQFDMGTAPIMPPTTQSKQKPYTPTVADYQRIIGELSSNPRFSHLNPKSIQELFASDLKAAEEAYKQSQRAKYAEAYRNATDGRGQVVSTMPGVIEGYIPESIGNMIHNQAIANRPQISTVNTGGQQRIIAVVMTTACWYRSLLKYSRPALSR